MDKFYLAHLLQSVVNNDCEESFGKLFSALYGRLVSFSKNFVSNQQVAEEIVADVFVNLWNNRKEDGPIQNIEGYLYIAVKNRSLNYINRVPQKFVEISERNTLDINQLVDPFDPEKEMELQELQHDIRIAIDTLPPQSKAVFQMIKEEGFKYKEVAEILNISPRTVETQLVRALKRLDIALMPYLLKKSKKKRTIPDQLPPFLFLILSYLAG